MIRHDPAGGMTRYLIGATTPELEHLRSDTALQ
jgi:hypothetical protein